MDVKRRIFLEINDDGGEVEVRIPGTETSVVIRCRGQGNVEETTRVLLEGVRAVKNADRSLLEDVGEDSAAALPF